MMRREDQVMRAHKSAVPLMLELNTASEVDSTNGIKADYHGIIVEQVVSASHISLAEAIERISLKSPEKAKDSFYGELEGNLGH
eukprot:scaffold95862_cov17-Prasinocladus_malaysianus.AAC.1